ncbi:unnamed protein product [Polarella glacialis]|uniref:Uncharacterized protein n=1 Tax=Polarella glacialis TaxID=89957 RepID=A0A813FA13_POLGL|nr:unnamed protein product [Polarella glacialis]
MRRRWWIACEAFVQMLVLMRKEFTAGRGWMEGMRRLLDDPPKGQVSYTAGDHLGFDEFVAALMHDVHVALQPRPGRSQAEGARLASLISRLESFVTNETRFLSAESDWTSHPEAFGKASREAAAKANKATSSGASDEFPLGGFGLGRRHLLFVGLPVALYCTDCPHLYQLLHRLRGLTFSERPATAKSLRSALDYDDRPYSVLVYALMAGLQALHASRLPPGGFEGIGVSGGLEALAPNGEALIFRGLWVPEVIDEHRAEHSWAFNSFSRSIEGVLSVLNFYACASGSEARELAKQHSHLLLLVARFRGNDGGSQWAFPVQLFAGGEFSFPASVEQEVLVPPFSRYYFENDLEVSSSQAQEVRSQRLKALEERWAGVQIEKDAAGLLSLLAGETVHLSGFLSLGRPPRITVRFVRLIEPAAPIRELFGAVAKQADLGTASKRLLNFPRDWTCSKGSLQDPCHAPHLRHGMFPRWQPPSQRPLRHG